MRNLYISLFSLFMTIVVIGNAYFQKKQFYPTVIFLTKSNPSMAVLYIQAFILVILMGKLMRKVFFGELRPVELEHLMERSWYAVTETCLAFTVFRDDFSPKFVALFTLLLFLKSFHWLAEERVDFMERSPVISVLFHVRILSLLMVLGSLDMNFVSHAYQSTLTKGASVQLVFGFEYAILLTIILNIIIKYTLHTTDLHREMPWEHKAVFLLYTELVMGFIKVVLYFLFVFIMIRIYTLPLFAFRPMYYTVRAFKKAFNDVIMSRRAIRNMNTLYPDATPEELAAADNVCIICREEMTTGVASKKLPCNHIFHTSCLRSWFQRQQTCPTCRLNILRAPVATPPNPPPQQRVREQPLPQQIHPQQIHPQQPEFPWIVNANAPGSTNDQNTAGSSPFTRFPPNAPLPEQMFIPPFPHMPFNVAPPMPPFSSLSDEELKKIESETREGLEARIRVLQNIQTLLDVSCVMLAQYCAAAAQGNGNQNQQNHEAEENESNATKDASNVAGPSSQTESPSSQQKNNDLSDSVNAASTHPTESDLPSSSCSSKSSDVKSISQEQELARQRRLEMFDKHQTSE